MKVFASAIAVAVLSVAPFAASAQSVGIAADNTNTVFKADQTGGLGSIATAVAAPTTNNYFLDGIAPPPTTTGGGITAGGIAIIINSTN